MVALGKEVPGTVIFACQRKGMDPYTTLKWWRNKQKLRSESTLDMQNMMLRDAFGVAELEANRAAKKWDGYPKSYKDPTQAPGYEWKV